MSSLRKEVARLTEKANGLTRELRGLLVVTYIMVKRAGGGASITQQEILDSWDTGLLVSPRQETPGGDVVWHYACKTEEEVAAVHREQETARVTAVLDASGQSGDAAT